MLLPAFAGVGLVAYSRKAKPEFDRRLAEYRRFEFEDRLWTAFLFPNSPSVR
jgi:hypothetical protein